MFFRNCKGVFFYSTGTGAFFGNKKQTEMTFVINYNRGYEVGVVMVGEDGYLRTYPLRNFGQRQGDAMMFRQHDCPRLSMLQIKSLINRYDPSTKYNRIDENTFRIQNKHGY